MYIRVVHTMEDLAQNRPDIPLPGLTGLQYQVLVSLMGLGDVNIVH